MARIVFALLLMTVAFSQATVLPATHVAVLPNLVLVLLLVWAAMRGVVEGMAWVFGIGLLLDVLSMDAFGTNALSLLVVALLAGLARRRFFHSGMIVPIVLVIVATIVHVFMLSVLRSVGHPDVALGPGATLRMGLLQALLNAVCVPLFYWIATWVNRWVTDLERA